MINEAKRKHGITHREFKKTDSDLNIANKMQVENKKSKEENLLSPFYVENDGESQLFEVSSTSFTHASKCFKILRTYFKILQNVKYRQGMLVQLKDISIVKGCSYSQRMLV